MDYNFFREFEALKILVLEHEEKIKTLEGANNAEIQKIRN